MTFVRGELVLNGFWHIVISLGLLLAWRFVVQGRIWVRGTTLHSAWLWSLIAAIFWVSTWFADQCLAALSSGFADHAWYANSVLSLCPTVAVLGSRRPGVRIWNAFIMFPMLLVLGWPVIALAMQVSELRGLQLETPQVLAFLLVLVMGLGNYCGTRLTIPALLYGCSIAALVISSSTISPAWLANRPATRFFSTALMMLAVGLIKFSGRPVTRTGFDQVWIDFFDTFGIVWARRIQDRVNFMLEKERLPVRLELDGFAWSNQSSEAHGETKTGEAANPDLGGDGIRLDTAYASARVEHVLRWLLRRFVDPDWIDRRLGATTPLEIRRLPVDS